MQYLQIIKHQTEISCQKTENSRENRNQKTDFLLLFLILSSRPLTTVIASEVKDRAWRSQGIASGLLRRYRSSQRQ